MPDLYYGPHGLRKKPELYTSDMQPVMTSVFDSFRLYGFAPESEKRHVANLWHWAERGHTILSWHDLEKSKHEYTLFMSSLLDHASALEYARLRFPLIVPSPLTFRISQRWGKALEYDDDN